MRRATLTLGLLAGLASVAVQAQEANAWDLQPFVPAWALQVIATPDTMIRIVPAGPASVIAVTDVKRQGREVVSQGPTRVYTEQRPEGQDRAKVD